MQVAPKCPWWCNDGNHTDEGWDGDGTKTCRRRIPAVEDIDGEGLTILLERFVYAVEGGAEESVPTIRIEAHGLLTVDAAEAAAWTVIRAAEMTREPPPLAMAG